MRHVYYCREWPQIKRALISVTDKTGVVEFAQGLRDLGVEIISTGGTARALEAAGSAGARSVRTHRLSRDAGWAPENHPSAHRGRRSRHSRQSRAHAVARRARHPAHRHGGGESLRSSKRWRPSKACRLSELIENIDIGGPTMIRAAAKNYQDVAVVISPDDYPAILEELHEREGQPL